VFEIKPDRLSTDCMWSTLPLCHAEPVFESCSLSAPMALFEVTAF